MRCPEKLSHVGFMKEWFSSIQNSVREMVLPSSCFCFFFLNGPHLNGLKCSVSREGHWKGTLLHLHCVPGLQVWKSIVFNYLPPSRHSLSLPFVIFPEHLPHLSLFPITRGHKMIWMLLSGDLTIPRYRKPPQMTVEASLSKAPPLIDCMCMCSLYCIIWLFNILE